MSAPTRSQKQREPTRPSSCRLPPLGLDSILARRCPKVKALFQKHEQYPAFRLTPIRCKTWSCPVCAKINTYQIIQRIAAGNPTHFLTVTARPDPSRSPHAYYAFLRSKLARLISWLKRKKVIRRYVIVTELTRAGIPHFHIAYSGAYFPQDQISERWQRLSGSRIVWIERIKNPRHCAKYLAKYLAKSLASPSWIKRRIQFSRSYSPSKDTPFRSPWITLHMRYHPSVIHERLTAFGYSFATSGCSLIYATPPVLRELGFDSYTTVLRRCGLPP